MRAEGKFLNGRSVRTVAHGHVLALSVSDMSKTPRKVYTRGYPSGSSSLFSISMKRIADIEHDFPVSSNACLKDVSLAFGEIERSY